GRVLDLHYFRRPDRRRAGDVLRQRPGRARHHRRRRAAPDLVLCRRPDPRRQPAKLTVTFYPEGGQPVVQGYTVGPRSRFSLYADPVLPNVSFGAKVESDQPIVAERAVYFGQGRGGTDSSGVASPAKEWFLPEGSTAKPYHETLAL